MGSNIEAVNRSWEDTMASVYRKNNGTYYISVMFQRKRLTRSLGTSSYQNVRKLIPIIEKQLLAEIIEGKKRKQNKSFLKFSQLVNKYIEYPNHDWSKRTRALYKGILNKYQLIGLPDNPTTRAMTIRVINSCNNWGFKHGLISKPVRLQGGSKWESRHRVFNKDELQLLFDEVRDERFNCFVRFAYYTGARAGEIRRLKKESIFSKHLVVNGKSGKRIIKLNSQARDILNQMEELWNYRRDFVSHKFKKEVRRLGIKDARFHDLRRTFGYNLIKQGRPIYEVSKLLGHSSVTTTERHYAPLLTTEIEDFVL